MTKLILMGALGIVLVPIIAFLIYELFSMVVIASSFVASFSSAGLGDVLMVVVGIVFCAVPAGVLVRKFRRDYLGYLFALSFFGFFSFDLLKLADQFSDSSAVGAWEYLVGWKSLVVTGDDLAVYPIYVLIASVLMVKYLGIGRETKK